MCLYSEKNEPFVAELDITCYKVLEKIEGRYRTPYRYIPITIPGRIEAALPEMTPSRYGIYSDKAGWIVEREGVHAFIEKEKAEQMAIVNINSGFDSFVAECRIPASTQYWLGDNGDIAAREMHIEKLLDF